ncbi:MAG: hypothetical protein HYZ36_03520 [Pedosphaera parvula]|nr:hypothetical protein [Pedosphaera parvula]
MGTIDQATQANAATAEETASATEELSAQANELRQLVLELETVVRGGVGAEAGPDRHAARGEAARYSPSHDQFDSTSRRGGETVAAPRR